MPKQSGMLHPTDYVPNFPDTVHHWVTSAASSAGTAYTADWPTSTIGSSNPPPSLVEIKSDVSGWFCPGSTLAILPTTNTTTTPSTAGIQERFLANVPYTRMVSGNTTGYSILAFGGGFVDVTLWSR